MRARWSARLGRLLVVPSRRVRHGAQHRRTRGGIRCTASEARGKLSVRVGAPPDGGATARRAGSAAGDGALSARRVGTSIYGTLHDTGELGARIGGRRRSAWSRRDRARAPRRRSARSGTRERVRPPRAASSSIRGAILGACAAAAGVVRAALSSPVVAAGPGVAARGRGDRRHRPSRRGCALDRKRAHRFCRGPPRKSRSGSGSSRTVRRRRRSSELSVPSWVCLGCVVLGGWASGRSWVCRGCVVLGGWASGASWVRRGCVAQDGSVPVRPRVCRGCAEPAGSVPGRPRVCRERVVSARLAPVRWRVCRGCAVSRSAPVRSWGVRRRCAEPGDRVSARSRRREAGRRARCAAKSPWARPVRTVRRFAVPGRTTALGGGGAGGVPCAGPVGSGGGRRARRACSMDSAASADVSTGSDSGCVVGTAANRCTGTWSGRGADTIAPDTIGRARTTRAGAPTCGIDTSVEFGWRGAPLHRLSRPPPRLCGLGQIGVCALDRCRRSSESVDDAGRGGGTDQVPRWSKPGRITMGDELARKSVRVGDQAGGRDDPLHGRGGAPFRRPRRGGWFSCPLAAEEVEEPHRRSPPEDAGVDPADLVDEPPPVGVLEVEDVVQRPVEVVGDVRDLLVAAGRPRTSRFPQAAHRRGRR